MPIKTVPDTCFPFTSMSEFLENLDSAGEDGETFGIRDVHGGYYENLGGYEYRMLLGAGQLIDEKLDGGSEATAFGFDVSDVPFDANATLSLDLSIGLNGNGDPDSFYARLGDLDFALGARVDEGGLPVKVSGQTHHTTTATNLTPLNLEGAGKVSYIGDWLQDGVATKAELDAIEPSTAPIFSEAEFLASSHTDSADG